MNQKYSFCCAIFLTIIIFHASCKSDEKAKQVETTSTFEIEELELFADFDQHGLVRPVQIEILPNSNLAVLDSQTNKVHLLTTDGEILNTFGREGNGPGEFQRATQLLYSENYLYVVDANLHQINQFSYSGDFIKRIDVDPAMYQTYVTLMNDESYYTMTMGENGSLIKKSDVNSGATHFFGKAPGDEFQPGNFEKELRTLQRGEIPDFMKNDITKHISGDHLYVFLNTLGRLQKYTSEGRLLWDKEINMPVNQAIFDNAVEQANDAEWGIPSFKYILSIKVIDKEPYLLWNSTDGFPQNMVKTDADGQLLKIIKIHDNDSSFSDFSIDSKNNILYLIDFETGQIYRTKLPG
ncbi:6-bladed beta-propeller [Rhodohalobacter mucosus]|uniref:6-bladed beta-propeller protein n=1 Tax=Rhodohalobacter mucosus TaxID=2079485 RepID=A0A316TPS9_9BACT|nr:6-bladed beta-propeller [Rhodohalobacter mucosus]PWN05035.1 hypothetical protein DDZ15_16560 [Rhodohalobacter mucosus]